MADEPEVILYTDGACSGNPGPGGWAFILRHLPTGRELERSGGESETTNNRMELQAVVEGLSSLNRSVSVRIVSDSAYVLNGLSTWIKSWKKNGWKRKDGSKWVEVKNVDLWKRLDDLAASHKVEFSKIKGHSGHPENERCDELAVTEWHKFK
ncbi:MAG: ribonuclease HI [Thermoguttaceae bacterium]|nr:ribonuclease HI [Thermoguttaceae bacterium]MBQ2039766.1 ribonuclease HI [Thermoguttaceae bacterium]MBQ2556443.1 ribonuclease HI [Thermoguttaceae bacterium]MBQ5367460.1 ribonuclease HI [Thermoguttaceae bacterium]